MRPTRYAAALALAAAILGGCTPKSVLPALDNQAVAVETRRQQHAAISAELASARLLHETAYTVLQRNHALCGKKVAAKTGALFASLETYDGAFLDAAADLGVGYALTVIALAPGSPAARSGLELGDRLVAVGNVPLGNGKAAFFSLSHVLGQHPGRPLVWTVSRRRVRVSVTVASEPACDYPVHLLNDDRVNAFADGKALYVTTGMLDFVRSADELALVVGHELSHNTLGHRKAKTANTLAGAGVGVLLSAVLGVDVTDALAGAGGAMHSQAFEREADYVGVYHAARAGFRTRDAADFWRRLAVRHPHAIHAPAGASHPSTAERFVAIAAASREVEDKRTRNLPLVPNRRP